MANKAERWKKEDSAIVKRLERLDGLLDTKNGGEGVSIVDEADGDAESFDIDGLKLLHVGELLHSVDALEVEWKVRFS